MELTDLLSVEEWMHLEEEIHARFGLDNVTVILDSGIRFVYLPMVIR